MRLIDMHCDTIGKILNSNGSENLMENHCQISIPSMKKANTLMQFFACFTHLGEYENAGGYEACYQRALQMIDCMKEQIMTFPDEIALARSYNEMMENNVQEKLSALLTIEEGGILNGRMERLEELYHKGVRLMTLMWNYENCLGYPNSKDPAVMQKGLKPFGIEVTERMGELGMIVDVSHASDGTFADILQHAKGPVVASHSNCRALCDHSRNLTDEMIRALAEKGGISGLNIYSRFLGTIGFSKVSEMTEHILHMIRVGGSDFPAIGTDFDGISEVNQYEIAEPAELEKLWNALKCQGVTESQLDKIWSGNAIRIIKEIA